MTATSDPRQRRTGVSPRPDPFLLPSATTIRFMVLIAVSYVASLYASGRILGTVGALRTVGRTRCSAALEAAAPSMPPGSAQRYIDCMARGEITEVAAVSAAALLPFAAAVLIYTVHPYVLRARLRPLDLDGGDPVLCFAEEHMRAAVNGSVRRVELLVTPGTARGARAFGAWGRYWIAVDLPLLIAGSAGSTEEETRARARAVILHEAAHVRNRDVDVSYLTRAVWWGVLLCAFTPLVAAAAARGADRPSDLVLALAALLTPLLVVMAASHVSRNLTLHAREYYADARVLSSSSSAAQALDKLLGHAARQRPTRSRAVERAFGMLRHHPEPSARRLALRDPHTLFRVGLFETSMTAAVAGAGGPVLVSVVAALLPGIGVLRMHHTTVGLFLGGMVAFVVTVGLWKEVSYARHRGSGRPRIWPVATALTVGLMAGRLAAPTLAGGGSAAPLVERPVHTLLLAAVLFLVCLFVVRWSLWCATLWAADVQRPLASLLVCAASSAAIFGLLVAWWSRSMDAVASLPFLNAFASPVFFLLTDAGVFAAVGWACACPALAWFRFLKRGRSETAAADEAGLSTHVWHPMLPVASGTVVVLASTATAVAAVALPGVEPGPPVWGILVVLVVFSLAAAVFLGRRLGGNDGGRGRSGRVLGATGVMTMVVASLFLLVFVLVSYLATDNVLLPTAMTFSYAYFASAVPLCLAAAAAAAWSASRAGRRPRPVRRPRRAWPTAVVSGIVLLLPFVVFYSEPPNTFSTHVPQERREIAADALRRIDDGELPRLPVERACGVGRGEVPAGAAMPPVRDDRWQVERDIGLASADDPVVSGLGRRALAEAAAGDRQAYETLRTAALHYCGYTGAA